MALQDAMDWVQDTVGALEGMRGAPHEPTESVQVFPFSRAYAGEGVIEMNELGMDRGLHSIVVEIHVGRQDLPRDVKKAMPYVDSVPAALLASPTLGGTVSTFGRIRYRFGPMAVGGEDTIGFRFWLEDVKVQVNAER